LRRRTRALASKGGVCCHFVVWTASLNSPWTAEVSCAPIPAELPRSVPLARNSQDTCSPHPQRSASCIPVWGSNDELAFRYGSLHERPLTCQHVINPTGRHCIDYSSPIPSDMQRIMEFCPRSRHIVFLVCSAHRSITQFQYSSLFWTISE
jgi:hypothetical protein